MGRNRQPGVDVRVAVVIAFVLFIVAYFAGRALGL